MLMEESYSGKWQKIAAAVCWFFAALDLTFAVISVDGWRLASCLVLIVTGLMALRTTTLKQAILPLFLYISSGLLVDSMPSSFTWLSRYLGIIGIAVCLVMWLRSYRFSIQNGASRNE